MINKKRNPFSKLKQTTMRISILGRQGHSRKALSELIDFVKTGSKPDVRLVTALINACSKSQHTDLAQRIFEYFFGGHNPIMVPDEITFKVLLNCYLMKTPPGWKAAFGILKIAETKFHCRLSTISYNCLLNASVISKDRIRGAKIIEKMLYLGIEPDENTLKLVKTRKSLRCKLKKKIESDSLTNL